MVLVNNKIIHNKVYVVLKLLGHGKGGYSYLAEGPSGRVVLKQIHHEPCDYYTFGNKMESELRDYERLKNTGIPMPTLLDYDMEQEIIIKEYKEGPTIASLVEENLMKESYYQQIEGISKLLKKHHINIDYYPTNFVVEDETLYYIDYECNEYMEEWSYEAWGKQYWYGDQASFKKA